MNVDVHAHIVNKTYLDELTSTLGLETELTGDGKRLLRKNGCTIAWSRADMFEIDDRLSEMDKKDIAVRILSLSAPNVYLWDNVAQVAAARKINDALAKMCKRHPDRFVGLASLPLKDIERSLVELDRCIHELGMRGVVIGSNVDGLQLDDPRFDPVWKKINELRLPVFEHPMFPNSTAGFEGFELPLRLGLIFDTTLAAARLIYSGIFERYPDFPYIMAHTGGALLMALERVDNGYRLFPDRRRYITKLPSAYAKRLFYDTTAFDKKALTFALATVGPGQLLFGTDDPFIDADTSHVTKLPVSSLDREKILGAMRSAYSAYSSRVHVPGRRPRPAFKLARKEEHSFRILVLRELLHIGHMRIQVCILKALRSRTITADRLISVRRSRPPDSDEVVIVRVAWSRSIRLRVGALWTHVGHRARSEKSKFGELGGKNRAPYGQKRG